MRLVKRIPVLLCLLAAVMVAACSGSSPTAAEGSPLFFSGTVTAEGTSTHDFDMVDDGLLEVTLTNIRVLLFDTSQGSATNIFLGFGIGQRDDAGECILTTNILLSRNDVRVYRLSRDTYCLSIFDPGAFPEDALLGYELQADITI